MEAVAEALPLSYGKKEEADAENEKAAPSHRKLRHKCQFFDGSRALEKLSTKQVPKALLHKQRTPHSP